MVAAKIANLGWGVRADSREANLPLLGECDAAPVTNAAAAEMLNVSERTVKAARTVQRDAVPELAATVESGAVSVSAAADVARLPEAEQVDLESLPLRHDLDAPRSSDTIRTLIRNQWTRSDKTNEIACFSAQH